MVKNKIVKIVYLFIATFMILGALHIGVCEAATATPFDNPDAWKPTIEDDKDFTAKAGKLLAVINAVGIIISVVILAVLGIKFMMGSVEEKATYKKDFIPYLIGIFMLAMATTLPNAIYSIVKYVLD